MVHDLMQRLYHEVRKALTHACVKPCTAEGSQAGQWHHWSSTTGQGRAIDRQDLPGPYGARHLHLRRSEGPDAEDLDMVCRLWLAIVWNMARVTLSHFNPEYTTFTDMSGAAPNAFQWCGGLFRSDRSKWVLHSITIVVSVSMTWLGAAM